MRWILSVVTGVVMSQALLANVFIKRPEVIQFIDEVAEQHKLDKQHLTHAFGQITTSADVIARMTTQYEALPWHKYRASLVTTKKIKGGVDFWKTHARMLKQAEKKYGVPAELIVAIIGIESMYGQSCGKYPVMQSLATLAFDYPPRSEFFKNELKEYLLLVSEQRLDPLALRGSYAGAMGIPQFIASSYRNFAVDFDNSGQIDLHNNMPQVIGSIANYFKEHGWQKNAPVIVKAITKGQKHKNLPIAARNNPIPEIPLKTLYAHDVKTKTKIKNPNTNVAWLEFETPKGKEYYLGMTNFYVITRYNHSSNYAFAVHQLGSAIAQQYKTKTKINSKTKLKTKK